MQVTLIRAWPRRFEEIAIELPAGATVGDALVASGWKSDAVAVFGVRATPQDALHDGDRIELLRPLLADPKQARRARADARREQARQAITEARSANNAEEAKESKEPPDP